jgi:hypothetical protein
VAPGIARETLEMISLKAGLIKLDNDEPQEKNTTAMTPKKLKITTANCEELIV